MTRAELIEHHQQRAADYYQYARWAAGKASKQRQPFESGLPNVYYMRISQFEEESRLGDVHAATARILMGIAL